MGPKLARALLLLGTVSFAGVIAWIGPYWWEPVPLQGEIVDCFAKHNYADARRLIDSFLFTRKGEPITRLFCKIDGSHSKMTAPAAVPVVISPRDRCLGTKGWIQWFDPRPDAARNEYYARLEVEGREPRMYGPTGAGSTMIDLGGDSLGPPGAAGRVVLLDRVGEIARASFVILSQQAKQELTLRLAVVDRMAPAVPEAGAYVRAMTFTNEQCYSDALRELAWLLSITKNDPTLLMFQKDLWHRLGMTGAPQN